MLCAEFEELKNETESCQGSTNGFPKISKSPGLESILGELNRSQHYKPYSFSSDVYKLIFFFENYLSNNFCCEQV